MKVCEAWDLIILELERAEIKHPVWPYDIVHGAAILAEEAGEVVKAALDVHYANGSIEALKLELAHTGAMAIRNLINLKAKGD